MLIITNKYLYLYIINLLIIKKNAMKTTQETTQELLDLLLSFDKDQLRDELEQLLLSLNEKGSNLELLKNYYKKGGCRQQF